MTSVQKKRSCMGGYFTMSLASHVLSIQTLKFVTSAQEHDPALMDALGPKTPNCRRFLAPTWPAACLLRERPLAAGCRKPVRPETRNRKISKLSHMPNSTRYLHRCHVRLPSPRPPLLAPVSSPAKGDATGSGLATSVQSAGSAATGIASYSLPLRDVRRFSLF